MAEDVKLPGVAGGEGGAASAAAVAIEDKTPAGAASDAAANDAALASLADDAEEAGATTTWPDDWRERLASGDDDALRALKRFGSVDGLWKKIVNQQKLISEGGHKAPAALAEDATPEEVAAYRKASGVPDAPDGYGLQFAPEIRATETDSALLQSFQKDMHGLHMTPANAKAAFGWYQKQLQEHREAQAAAAQDARAETQVELRKEYGRNLKVNLALADEYLAERPALAKLVAGAPGVKTDLLKELITEALAVAPDGALISGDGAGGGKSREDRIAELVQKSITGKMSKAEDAELTHLYESRIAGEERQGRKRA